MTILDRQLGVAEETTFGTPVTPNRWYEPTSDSVGMEIGRIESAAMRSGARVLRSDRWVGGQRNVSGDIGLELVNRSFGLWLKHMMGGVATAQPDATGSPTVYEHTFTPDVLPTGLTIQFGRPSRDGTVHPFTYHGCKIGSWELTAAAGELVPVTVSLVGEDEDTSTALATASYPAGVTLFTFVDGALTIAGAAVDVSEVSLAGDNALADDRYFVGSALRKEPLDVTSRDYTGTIEAEFEDLTAYNRFVNGTEAALTLNFVGGTIENAFDFALEVTANVRFDGQTPQLADGEPPGLTLPYKCVDSGSGPASALTMVYRTDDATP